MSDSAHPVTRLAQLVDADVIGRLLHAFNVEFGELTPGPERLAARMRELLEEGQTAVLLGGGADEGLAVLRFRPAIWTEGLECYLAELYVAPEHRGRGVGRALLEAAIALARSRGATYMDLCSGEQDVAARALYESLGFSNREGEPDGSVNYYYEREL
jgi:ribosomal protein S18 acetylase RimI-like enzyme